MRSHIRDHEYLNWQDIGLRIKEGCATDDQDFGAALFTASESRTPSVLCCGEWEMALMDQTCEHAMV